jgi:predicted enzyme related to lactoylglutathione lyase
MSDSTLRGRFVWHELLTTDTKSAGAFFSKVIGWKVQPWGEDGSYTLFVSDGRQMAGMMMLPEEARKMGAPPNWMTYIGTADVDETARQAVSMGATVLKAPDDIPTIGRFAVIQDPQGATFAIFTPNQAPGAEAAPTIGDFSWHELATSDASAALTFYQRLFGWEETGSTDMGPDLGKYLMFGRSKGGRSLGGVFKKPPQMPGPASWLPYIKVPDSKKTAETIKSLGAKVVNGPMEVPGGDWITQAVDLQGALFAVHSAAAKAPAAPARPKAAAKKSARTAAPKSAKPAAPKSARPAAPKKKSAPAKKAAAKRAAPKKRAAGKSRTKAKPVKKSAKKSKPSKGKVRKSAARKSKKGGKRR